MAKERVKAYLPYSGIPAVCAALLISHVGRADVFVLLGYGLVVIFGYIAAVIDLKSRRIPNRLVVAMVAAWVLLMAPIVLLDTIGAVALLRDSVLGFAIGGGLFLLMYFVSSRGLGGGDVKLAAAAGLYLGLYGILPAILYGTVLASLFGITLILLRKIGRKDKIPLAPFLYIGILIAVFAP
jgi:Flp pilus assembly protein protease CpaA